MKLKHIIFLLILLSIAFLSCSDSVNNSITFQNLASNDVYVNFRGNIIDVPNGSTVQIKEIDKGEYVYETIFEIPANATSSEAGEGLAGTFYLRAGTKILVVYTSVLEGEVYKISASVSSSEDINFEEINPINP